MGKDEKEAVKWFAKAAEQGCETPKEILDKGRERLERLKSK